MHDENRYEYTVRTCDCEDIQALENILNQMSIEGWDLYSLNEVENDEGEYQYLCIFNKEINAEYGLEGDYIIDSGDFKTRMEKLLHKKTDLYEECRLLQRHIREKNQKLRETKQSLDSNTEATNREELNKEISERMSELSTLKAKFSELLSSSKMYNRISQNLLTITVSYELSELIDNEKDGDLIAESVRLRQKLTDKLGYVIPKVHFVISDEINENEYRINIRNLKALTGIVYPKYRRFFPGQSNIQKMPKNAIEDIDLITGQQVFWLQEVETKDFWDSGMTPSQVITSHLEFIVRKYVDEIIGYEDVLRYVALLSEEKAFLADGLISGGISLGDLKYLFSNLIKEKISVKDVSFIFEKLNDLSEHDYDKEKLLEKLRLSLKKQICSDIADSNNTIFAITIPEQYEKVLSESLKIVNEKNNNQELDKFIKYITKTYTDNQFDDAEVVLIAKEEYRKFLFNLFEQIIPGFSVISENEIAEEFNIQTL